MSEHRVTQPPPEVQAVLRHLRSRIRRYVFLEGVALVLVVLGLLFWMSLGVDALYFTISRLELPKWFRIAFDIVAIALFVLTFTVWVLARSIRRLRARALALVLERRFPELDDRLITAVEFAESTAGRETPLTRSMLDQMLDDVNQAARKLDLSQVFERRPLRRASLLSTVLLASVGGLWLTNAEAMERWVRAYIVRADEYWTRETHLIVKVIAQPGDRVRHFDDSLNYKHPRGDDLTLVIEVPENEDAGDGAPSRNWKVPDRVQLHYELADGRGTGQVTCTQIGERQFKYSVGNLLDSMRFWVTGGDYINRRPYQVVVVDPPRVNRIVLQSLYPRYTGWNRQDEDSGDAVRTANVVQGTQISLPMETDIRMQAQCNKPLTGVRLLYGPFELAFEQATAPVSHSRSKHDSTESVSGAGDTIWQGTLTLRSADGQPELTVPLPPESQAFLADDRMGFTVPFVMSADGTEKMTDRIRQADEAGSPVGLPLLLPPDSLMRIYLEDTDQIIGSDPARLTINGIIDQPPTIDTQLRGIGTSITRKAVIPLEGTITDDYGLATARFEFGLDQEQESQVAPFRNPPHDAPKQFRLQMSDRRAVEQFEVLPLDLSIGQELNLWVHAEDGDDLNGPHSSRSQPPYKFTIVSEEELLSILHEKELNLRRRFEQIIREVQETQKDLIFQRSRIQESHQPQSGDSEADGSERASQQLQQIETDVAASAERALHAIRKNANETESVEEAFRDIRDELVNNAVQTSQLMQRLEDHIIQPLHAINNTDYPNVDAALVRFRMANERRQNPTEEIDQCLAEIETMLEHMQSVLSDMRKLETFQEALELLKTIIADEEKLIEETKARQKKEALEKLKGLGLDE